MKLLPERLTSVQHKDRTLSKHWVKYCLNLRWLIVNQLLGKGESVG